MTNPQTTHGTHIEIDIDITRKKGELSIRIQRAQERQSSQVKVFKEEMDGVTTTRTGDGDERIGKDAAANTITTLNGERGTYTMQEDRRGELRVAGRSTVRADAKWWVRGVKWWLWRRTRE